MELALEHTQQGSSNEVSVLPEHPSDTKVLTMKMEILLEPTSNKLLVDDLTLRAGNPVKEEPEDYIKMEMQTPRSNRVKFIATCSYSRLNDFKTSRKNDPKLPQTLISTSSSAVYHVGRGVASESAILIRALYLCSVDVQSSNQRMWRSYGLRSGLSVRMLRFEGQTALRFGLRREGTNCRFGLQDRLRFCLEDAANAICLKTTAFCFKDHALHFGSILVGILTEIVKVTTNPDVSCMGKENGLQILQSIDQGPFELGTTRDTLGNTSEGGVILGRLESSELTKKQVEVSVCMMEFEAVARFSGENIMSTNDSALSQAVKLNKGLKETNHEQLYAYLKQHEKHAAQDRLIIERIAPSTNDPLAFVSSVQPYSQPSHSRHNQNQRNFAQGNGAAGFGGMHNRAGNVNAGQGKPIKCYNCNGIGHIARNCTQPKRP
ncbi:integrase, catalytic region, zinc finger, CCHC-type containing protein [Tanacetum coccineum]